MKKKLFTGDGEFQGPKWLVLCDFSNAAWCHFHRFILKIYFLKGWKWGIWGWRSGVLELCTTTTGSLGTFFYLSVLVCKMRRVDKVKSRIPLSFKMPSLESPKIESKYCTIDGYSQVASVSPPANVGSMGSVPGWGRSIGLGHGNPLQDSCLENPTYMSLVGYIS